jgi:predicted nucleic acid-binding Zn ribbon protein
MELPECLVCGETVPEDRVRDSQSKRIGVKSCSHHCGRIIRVNTRNIKRKGIRGGFPIRILIEIGRILDEHHGDWLTANQITDMLAGRGVRGEVLDVPNSARISNALRMHLDTRNVEFDGDGHWNRWRSCGDCGCLRDLLRPEAYRDLCDNYR